MDRLRIAGGVLTAAGVVGYLVGTVVPYPGRSFSLTAVLVGLTILAVRPPLAGGEPT